MSVSAIFSLVRFCSIPYPLFKPTHFLNGDLWGEKSSWIPPPATSLCALTNTNQCFLLIKDCANRSVNEAGKVFFTCHGSVSFPSIHYTLREMSSERAPDKSSANGVPCKAKFLSSHCAIVSFHSWGISSLTHFFPDFLLPNHV